MEVETKGGESVADDRKEGEGLRDLSIHMHSYCH